MALPAFNRSPGLVLLAIWLIVSGLQDVIAVALPLFVLPVVAVIAGVLILLGE